MGEEWETVKQQLRPIATVCVKRQAFYLRKEDITATVYVVYSDDIKSASDMCVQFSKIGYPDTYNQCFKDVQDTIKTFDLFRGRRDDWRVQHLSQKIPTWARYWYASRRYCLDRHV